MKLQEKILNMQYYFTGLPNEKDELRLMKYMQSNYSKTTPLMNFEETEDDQI